MTNEERNARWQPGLKPTPSPGRCVNPACKDEIRCRGLCWRCYAVASRLVKDSLTTWQKLESEGKCLPTLKPGHKASSAIKDWLLSEVEVGK